MNGKSRRSARLLCLGLYGTLLVACGGQDGLKLADAGHDSSVESGGKSGGAGGAAGTGGTAIGGTAGGGGTGGTVSKGGAAGASGAYGGGGSGGTAGSGGDIGGAGGGIGGTGGISGASGDGGTGGSGGGSGGTAGSGGDIGGAGGGIGGTGGISGAGGDGGTAGTGGIGGAGGDGGTAGTGGIGGAGGDGGTAGAGGIGGAGGDGGTGGTGGIGGAGGDGGTGGVGGTGGTGGVGGTGGTGGVGGTGGTGGVGGTGGKGGTGGSGGIIATHLLLSEVVASPTQAEYVAVRNLGTSPVDLTNVYLADFANYYWITDTGTNPALATPVGADFVVRFPAGASIQPGETQYVSVGGAECYKSACGSVPDGGVYFGYGIYPTYEIPHVNSLYNSAVVPDMIAPFTNAVGANKGLTNNGEPVILFYWDGLSALVTDIDYVFYGTGTGAVNKTGVTVRGFTYLNDTVDSDALHAPLGSGGQTMGTCRSLWAETGEVLSGGNGKDGHDETSEPNATNWIGCTP